MHRFPHACGSSLDRIDAGIADYVSSTCWHLVIPLFGAVEVSSLKTDVGPDESKSDAPNKPAAPAVCSSCDSITRCLLYSTSKFHFRRYGLRTFDGKTSHMQGNGAQMDLSGRQVQIIRLLLLLSRGVELCLSAAAVDTQ